MVSLSRLPQELSNEARNGGDDRQNSIRLLTMDWITRCNRNSTQGFILSLLCVRSHHSLPPAEKLCSAVWHTGSKNSLLFARLLHSWDHLRCCREECTWNWQAEDRQGSCVVQLTQPLLVSRLHLSQCVAVQWESSLLHFSAWPLSHWGSCNLCSVTPAGWEGVWREVHQVRTWSIKILWSSLVKNNLAGEIVIFQQSPYITSTFLCWICYTACDSYCHCFCHLVSKLNNYFWRYNCFLGFL